MGSMAEAEEQQDELNAREGRSPGYPFIPLNQALERTRALRKAIKANEARIATAGSVWELGVKSSGLRQTVAALKHFGLIDYIGSGSDRKIKLTDAAHRIILDDRPESPERLALVQKAALMPKNHAQFWEKWGPDLPPDVEMQAELTLERGFSQIGAVDAIAVYKGTLAFAKLIPSDNMPLEAPDNLDTPASQSHDRSKVGVIQPVRNPPTAIEDRIAYRPGQDIVLRFTGPPDAEAYEFLKDYLDFRIAQLKKQKQP